MEPQHNSQAPAGRGKLSRWKTALIAVLSAVAIVIVSAVVFLFHPDPFINAFLKGRITEAFQKAYPAYAIRLGTVQYAIGENRANCDSIVIEAGDSTLKASLVAFSISGVGWWELIAGNGLASNAFTGAVMEASNINLVLPAVQYEFRCGGLRLSVPDSDIIARALELHPVVDDQMFFAGKSRRTRFTLAAQQCLVTGVAYREALDRRTFRARRTRIQDVYLDVLINKDKPAIRDRPAPSNPDEIFFSMGETIRCDSMAVVNGALHYAERFEAGSKAAVITFDSMQVGAERIASAGGANDTVVIRAKGEFMKAGKTTIAMSIPLSSPAFSFRYSGSLHAMDLRALNQFVEIAEQQRVKSGTLQTAAFDINVRAGRSGGSVQAVYRNLTLAAINKHTGSENGFIDGLASYFANTYKIRGTNVPDKSGAMKIGQVKYTRHSDDPFFRFVWFSLRSGVGDVVGF